MKNIHKVKLDSIIDNDLYKFTMMWAVMNHFPNAQVRYEFVNRRPEVKFPKGIGKKLREIIDKTRDIKITKEERRKFQERTKSYLPNLFFDFLEGFRLDPTEVSIMERDGDLEIIIEGYWYRVILWEIILMSLLSELNFVMKDTIIDEQSCTVKDHTKGKKLRLNNVQVVDFGTRRRYSYKNHERMIKSFKDVFDNPMIGTSNVKLGIENGLKIIGTYAHEWVSGVAAILGYAHANKHAMELWTQTYQGNLGIALTDTFGMGAFINDFDKKYAELFTGVRHDSGCPFKFTDVIIEMYKRLGIDPTTKTIVFSDGLDVDKAIELSDYCNGKIKTSFGIGTHLTNDVGVQPLNIVIKLFNIDGKDVIKLSDIAGKHTGNKRTIELVKELIEYKTVEDIHNEWFKC